MIIDDNAVLWDSGKVVASGVGKAVALNAFKKPGGAEAVLITLRVAESLAGASSVTVKLQQADAADLKDGTFADVPGMAVTLPAAEFVEGAKLPWRWLPKNVDKPWLKLVVTVTGTATAGKLFAAIVREDDQPYEPGLYVNAGKVKG